ncbi:MAG: DUF655 domain-containing protein [Candidatus Korarchaeum sp.]|nr:DUF655 domain-containing protein [Candidatus Korarchaeum sp.]MDW8034948.1 DUF655 domain-containing protein [Candidatus Korarchaeum sp.]
MWRFAQGRRRPHDSWAYALHIDEARRRVQLIGDRYFILMEFALRPNVNLNVLDKVYVGKGPRKEVSKFIRYLGYEELSPTSRMILESVISRIVREGEQFFVNLFNESIPITTRLHQLELLPGIGKKTLLKVLEERSKRPFSSFSDVAERAGIKDPADLITKRVLDELMGKDKYYILVAPKDVLEIEEIY